jgi:hypothetical protein
MASHTGQSFPFPTSNPTIFYRYHQLSCNRGLGLAFDSTRPTFIAPISTSSSNAFHSYRRTTIYSQISSLPTCSFSLLPLPPPQCLRILPTRYHSLTGFQDVLDELTESLNEIRKHIFLMEPREQIEGLPPVPVSYSGCSFYPRGRL